jgi:thioredoxin 1
MNKALAGPVLAAIVLFSACSVDHIVPASSLTPSPEGIVVLDTSNFSEQVSVDGRVCMVDFYEPWCSHCIKMDTIVSRLAARYKGRVLIGRVNGEKDTLLPGLYSISGWPTFIFFDGGNEVRRVLGETSEKTLTDILDGLLGNY